MEVYSGVANTEQIHVIEQAFHRGKPIVLNITLIHKIVRWIK